MGPGHNVGCARPSESPQEGHGLGCRERGVEHIDPPAATSGQQVGAAAGVVALDHGAQVLGVDDALKAEVRGEAPGPDAGRLADAGVVLVEAQGHRGDDVLGVAQFGDGQHDQRTTDSAASSKRWQVSVGVGVEGIAGRIWGLGWWRGSVVGGEVGRRLMGLVVMVVLSGRGGSRRGGRGASSSSGPQRLCQQVVRRG